VRDARAGGRVQRTQEEDRARAEDGLDECQGHKAQCIQRGPRLEELEDVFCCASA
jgi:hypothetical protein